MRPADNRIGQGIGRIISPGPLRKAVSPLDNRDRHARGRRLPHPRRPRHPVARSLRPARRRAAAIAAALSRSSGS